MKRKKLYLKIIITVIINPLLCFQVFSEEINNNQNIESTANISQTLDDYIYLNSDLKNAFIGVKIRDLQKKQDIYSLNADKMFTPASNTKIFTTLIALEKLGKDFVFKTTVTTDGVIETKSAKNRVIKGNLYFNFSGDPTFTHNHLKDLIEKLKGSGIKEIKGDIIINNSIFDNILYGPGWMWDDMDSCDSSPISPVFIDDNCVKVNLSVANNQLLIDSKSPVAINTSDVKIVSEDTEDLKVINFSNNSPLSISGMIGANNSAELEQSIYKPENYFIYLLKPMLKPVIFKGKIMVGKPSGKKTITLVQNNSKPLKEILKRFDKESHNLTGELLLKTVGLKEDGKTGSTKKGSQAMRKYLENTFHNSNFNLVDGSGLSRYNLVSPSLIMDLLEYIYANETYRDIVLAAFPLGGAEGTLKNRLKNIKNYKVIAKSGSMTGVNCLSGYLIRDNGKVFSFSIMINNANLGGKALRDIQDKILELVAI
jgi:D-alanyl-D-alanine carboxypeptidase/D-alanyl-D-alanine-endopeptidase (penicillin-binding protein 4)